VYDVTEILHMNLTASILLV